MLKVERHAVDAALAKQLYEFSRSDLTDLIAEMPSTQGALPGVFDLSRKLAATTSVAAPADQALRSAVHINAQAAAAMFTLHDQKVRGEPLSYSGPLGDRAVQIIGCAPNSSLGPTNHQLGLYSSLISRDGDANHRLCLLRMESVRHGDAQADEYHYPWIAMLGRISRGESLAGALAELTAASAPDRVRIASREHVEETLWLARTAAAAHAGDAAAVNEGLARSLGLFRKIWEKDPRAWRGWLSLGATAIACWALDRGIAIEVESEYLPRALLER